MNDLDKIIGVEHIELNQEQQKLLDSYTTYRKEYRVSNRSNVESKKKLLDFLNNFYKSLSNNEQSIAKSWLSYEMCNIDEMLITSLKISEFAIHNNLASGLKLSNDGQYFLLVMNPDQDVYKIEKLFKQQYSNVNCKIYEEDRE